MRTPNLTPKSSRLAHILLLLVASAGNCLSEERPQEPPLQEREQIAEKLLCEKLAMWQKRLKLKEWNISVVMSKPDRLRPATLGNIKWDPETKIAVIRVLHPSHYQMPFPAVLKDMEFTLVHELIHLTFSSLPRHEANLGDEERAINQIADALMQSGGSN